jgi:hypothetical protein
MALVHTARCGELFNESYYRTSLMAIKLLRAAEFDASPQFAKTWPNEMLSLDPKVIALAKTNRLLDRGRPASDAESVPTVMPYRLGKATSRHSSAATDPTEHRLLAMLPANPPAIKNFPPRTG